jgi:uncharacterized protein YqeY
MSKLKERISEELKTAMKAKDQKQVDAMRLLTAAIKQREVDERIVLNDNQIGEVIIKMIKQRKDSLEQYKAANREDLAKQEAYEIELLQRYLPSQLSDADLTQLVKDAIKEANATSAKDMGKLMGILKPKVQGRADMGKVSAKVKELLG